MPAWLVFVIIGLIGGFASGLFGVGGGIVIVPALIYWAGFSQHKATGTSLAVLLPPIGLAAAIEYYSHGNVDVRAAVILAVVMMIGAWGGAYVANLLPGPHLRLTFGIFVTGLGLYLIYGACNADEVTLFNAKDLDGWVAEGVKDFTKDGRTVPVWSVKNGHLVCTGKGFGFLRYDRRSLRRFCTPRRVSHDAWV